MKHFLLTISIVYLLLGSYTSVNGAEWVYYESSTSDNEFYYDKESITSSSKGIVEVWTKTVYSEKGKTELISLYQKKGIATEGYENLSHGIFLWTINCNKREYKNKSLAEYSTTGNTLFSNTLSPDRISWDPILPDSVMDSLYKTVCKGTKKKR